jgi:hypothetical protein
MEESGLVDRAQLLNLQGRSRRPQQALAKSWGYDDYPESAGGCLLTEPGFSNQLRDLLDHNSQATTNDVELLKAGRQFRLSASAKVIVGRNQADNDTLQKLAQPGQIRLRCINFSGPLAIFCGEQKPEDLQRAAAIVATYGKGKEEAEVDVLCEFADETSIITVKPMPRNKSVELILR